MSDEDYGLPPEEWAKLQPAYDPLDALTDALDEIVTLQPLGSFNSERMERIIAFAKAHGLHYTHPYWGDDIKRRRALLGAHIGWHKKEESA